jgi:flagellar hook-associated protein 1 FlgK
VSSRDALSGVDLDTEAVDLMRFQQAYAATSRVIQVARDTIQSIIDIR